MIDLHGQTDSMQYRLSVRYCKKEGPAREDEEKGTPVK
jgi:hypothetical protein